MPDNKLAALATEALKPVSSMFIDALLGPKLKRIRQWAEKKDIRERLESSGINDLLEAYFKRLLRRVSGINTIAFPLRELPLPEIYEPLKLTNLINRSNKQNKPTNFTAKDIQAGRNYLIIDSAGMGKSTFAKHLVLDIFDSTVKIPLFLELRRLSDSKTILEKLSKEIDESQEDINEKSLATLLEQGEYVLILDGFDELTEQERLIFGPQITELAIRFEKNSIILTSRPGVNIPDIAKSIVFNIESLERKQAESLTLRYDKVANTNIGKGLIGQFNNVSDEFLRTPLLVVLLYRTYSYNQSIATKVTSFYGEVFDAFYKGHDLSKSGFSRQKSSGLDVEDFRRLLRGFSFLMLTHQITSLRSMAEGVKIVEEAIKLTLVKPSTPSSFFNDLILVVPFLIKDGLEFRFIHKSLAEFFAAEYLVFCHNPDKIIKNIKNSNLLTTFDESINYIADLDPNLFRRSIVGPIAKSIVSEKKPIKDLFFRTLDFAYGANIKLEDTNSYDSDILSRTGMALYSSRRGFFFLFTYKKKKYRLNFTYTNEKSRYVPSAAWQYLTKSVTTESVLKFSKNKVENKSAAELISFFNPSKPITLKSKELLQIADNKILRSVIIFRIQRTTSSPGESRENVNILDTETCKQVLKDVREEQKNQRWLDTITSNSDNRK